MAESKFQRSYNKIKFKLKQKSPEILFGLGVVGVILTPILSAKATLKAVDKVDEYLDSLAEDQAPSKKEIAKDVVPCYIPTVVVTGITIASFAGSKHIADGRAAAVMSLLISERRTKQLLIDKMKEKFGESKTQQAVAEVHKQIEEEHRMKAALIPEQTAYDTGLGDLLIFDERQSRYFYASEDALLRAEKRVNERLAKGELWVTWNDFLDFLNLPYMRVADNLGWYEFDEWLEIEKTYTETSYGQKLLVIDYIPYAIPNVAYFD